MRSKVSVVLSQGERRVYARQLMQHAQHADQCVAEI